MRLKTALVSLLLLCPCALCYGQLRFASVSGKYGYAAMRAQYTADLDNGWILIPQFGYYRTSDDKPDENGSTSRYNLEALYELTDSIAWLAGAYLQPQTLGHEGTGYESGLQLKPFHYWGGFKYPVFQLKAGQSRNRSYVDISGHDLPGGALRQVSTWTELNATADLARRWHLQATWRKVLKYSSRVPANVTFNWADLPYMTAVLNGYLKDSMGAKISYQTHVVTPYVALVRFHYEWARAVSTAVTAGLHVRVWGVDVTGGVEILEPRHDNSRQTFFSLAVEAPL